jgi:hypothetical protein
MNLSHPSGGFFILNNVGANADGFMDKDEWQLNYSIYHNELKLRLDDVLRVQRKFVAEMKAKQLYLSA